MKVLVWLPVANELFVFKGVLDTIDYYVKKGCGFNMTQKLPITQSRNQFFRFVMDKWYDYLLFIDDDNYPINKDILDRMIKLDKDVVTWYVRRKYWKHFDITDEQDLLIKDLYFKTDEEIAQLTNDEVVIDWFKNQGNRNTFCVYERLLKKVPVYHPINKPITWDVDMCWAWFVLIKRNVIKWALDKYIMPFERKCALYWKVDNDFVELIYNEKEIEGKAITEKVLIPCDSDILFFERVKKAGFTVWWHKQAICNHCYVRWNDMYEVRWIENRTVKYDDFILEAMPNLKTFIDWITKIWNQ